MNESTQKVLHHGRQVCRTDGVTTPQGHQVYEVDGRRCWACAVVGLMDEEGRPLLVPETWVAWRPIQQGAVA